MGNYYRKYDLLPVSIKSAVRQSGKTPQEGKIFETKSSKKYKVKYKMMTAEE